MTPESCFNALVQLASRAIYLYDDRGPINQGRVFFFVFNFELTPFSDGQLTKGSARPTDFNREKIVSGNLLYLFFYEVFKSAHSYRCPLHVYPRAPF